MEPSKDKWNIVLLIFVIHGIGTLMPWNMFITAKGYFVEYKLGGGANSTITTDYAANFLQYLTVSSQIPNVLFNWLNIFLDLGGDLSKRMSISILVELVLFVVTVIMAMVDTASCPGLFFWVTMFTVVILSIAAAFYQNTIYGMAATFPFRYTGAVILGSNVCGLFVSIVNIASTYLFSSMRTAAIYYFITAMIMLLVCFDTFYALPLNKFFMYNQLSRKTDDNEGNRKNSHVPYWSIFKKEFVQLYNVYIIFFVTLAVFPAVNSDVKVSSPNFFIQDAGMYVQITCFLTFNLFAMLGSLTSYWIQWPEPKYLAVATTLRLVFIPLLLFCNYVPLNVERTLPVFINNDWIYWLIAILMAYTSGYFSALSMMYAPQTVEAKYQVKAGMFAAAMLMSGIFSGILFSFLTPHLV
ncbi:equilibrative nucleoside transporter 1 [Eurosta solidaginis]|uniref:equilibrative nucleoside transporter 1 n=1 Tax=Eurosta solidaginis TaxID=178769 RepID=UPI00353057A6